MAAFGRISAAAPPPLYAADNPAGSGRRGLSRCCWWLINVMLQVCVRVGSAKLVFHGGLRRSPGDRQGLYGRHPAGLASHRGARRGTWRGCAAAVPAEVLALRWPRLGLARLDARGGRISAHLYGPIVVIVTVLGIDSPQYMPGPNGQSPDTGSAGLVKEAMFDIANEPKLFRLVLLSVGIGAPLAEELIFRGQMFAALSRQRVGRGGHTDYLDRLGAASCDRAVAVGRPHLRHGAGLRLAAGPFRQPVGDDRLSCACGTVIYSLVDLGIGAA